MKLDKDNMRAAHFARQVDLEQRQPGESVESYVKGTAKEAGRNATKDWQYYQLGKKVLAKYTLTYSERRIRGTAMPQVPTDVVAFITVDAGHLAYNEAVRLAMFRKRR